MEKNEKILIVEDDKSLAQGLELNLRYEGYEVLVAGDGELGLNLALSEKPDLIVLDLRLPKMSGLEILQSLRDEDWEMPIIILSALNKEDDKVKGLRLGADDYVAKPFSLKELLARVETGLRRVRRLRKKQEEKIYRFGDVEVYPGERLVKKKGEEVYLTAKEFDLLTELLEQPERPFTRELLLKKVWGYDYEGTDRTVDNFMRSLRKKLEVPPRNPAYLVTVHGIGYMFKP